MSFPRYPNYKASGVEWLGDVPEGWAIRRVKRLFEIRKRIVGSLGFEVLSITQSGIRIRNIDNNDGQLSDDYSKYQLVEVGDFAMNGMDLLTGYVDISATEGVTSPDYRVFSMRDAVLNDSRFLLYLFQMGYRQKVFYAFGQGASMFGRWRFPSQAFNDFSLPVPPVDEQRKISVFLDREIAKIDALIGEQVRLIGLLKEKRQAVISQAVTKGLDPSAAMKPSGVEWLGDVPAHWDRVQLGRLCSQVSDGPHFSPPYVDEGYLFLSARNIRVDGWSLEDAKFVEKSLYEQFCKRVIPERGDVLYTKGGTTGVARVVDFDTPFQVWVHIAVLKIIRDLALPEYVAYALNSIGCYEQSQLFTRGATNQDLGLTRMVKIWLALPSLVEQQTIVAALDMEIAGIDDALNAVTKSSALLDERRASLISAAVTGKIDVRGLAAADAEAA